MSNCKKIAFYGKGGIGKSTIAANVSAALGVQGKKVLHIGCDPKGDSTRNLTSYRIPTVLKSATEKGTMLSARDVVYKGFAEVCCVEAGGPEAGIGCAGMGISVVADELNRLGLLQQDWDVILYDVLGDVVCGGFALPMRKHFADQIYIVSSSEFMSIYAANNIMKSVARYASLGKSLLGGIIHNRVSSTESRKQMHAYATRTGNRIIQEIGQSEKIRWAEYMRKTVIEVYPNSKTAASFHRLAKLILEDAPGYIPKPLPDEELDEIGKNLLKIELQKLTEEKTS